VPRPELQEAARKLLLAQKPGTRGLVGLVGAGGAGKTALATALCHDEGLQDEFMDGILWAWLVDGAPTASLNAMYTELTGEPVTFPSLELAALNFAKAIDRKRCLIVLDGAKQPSELDPFLRSGTECVRLVLTRNPELSRGAATIEIGAMTDKEAFELLSRGIQFAEPDARDLAAGLGHWALALDVGRRLLVERAHSGDSTPGAVKWLLNAIEKNGLDSLGDEEIGKAMGLSELDADTRKRLIQLADRRRPTVDLEDAGRMWKLDETDTEAFVRTLEKTSLARLDLRTHTVHLHPLLIRYAKSRSHAGESRATARTSTTRGSQRSARTLNRS
jgi:GTPase SAR1 family protein